MEAIEDLWTLIRQSIRLAIEGGDPPGVPNIPGTYTNILKALMAGHLECFVIGEVSDDPEVKDNFRILAIATTVISTDPISLAKFLNVYTIASFITIKDDLWKWAFDHLITHAKEKGCVSMIALTRNDRVVDILDHLGANTKYQLIDLEIPNVSS